MFGQCFRGRRYKAQIHLAKHKTTIRCIPASLCDRFLNGASGKTLTADRSTLSRITRSPQQSLLGARVSLSWLYHSSQTHFMEIALARLMTETASFFFNIRVTMKEELNLICFYTLATVTLRKVGKSVCKIHSS